MKKYGYKFAWSSPEVQKNIQKRNMEKYGVKCTFQLKKVTEKSSFFLWTIFPVPLL